MLFGYLLRTPRWLLALFLALTLLPTSALVWLGWRALDQDRMLEQQRWLAHDSQQWAQGVGKLLNHAGSFLDQLKRAQEDIEAGRLIDHEELVRKHPASDE